MNIGTRDEGRFGIDLPRGQAGDHLDLRAEVDVVIALSACPADRNPCSAYDPTPVRVAIYRLPDSLPISQVAAR